MMDKQTSDERLLKLIEGEAGPKRPGVIAPGLRKSAGSRLSPKFNFFELKAKFKGLKISLFLLNRGLIGIAALLTLAFLYTLLSGPAGPKANGSSFPSADASAIMKLISGDVQGLMRKTVLQDIKRDFFLPVGSERSASRQEEESLDLTEEAKHLKLVGIIWSQDPEVMIENEKDSRTYIFKKGESLNGEFKVKEISRTSVTLELVTQSGMREYVMR